MHGSMQAASKQPASSISNGWGRLFWDEPRQMGTVGGEVGQMKSCSLVLIGDRWCIVE